MVEQEVGEKIDSKILLQSEKEITIWKWQVFVQYLTVHIGLTGRKTSLITVFPPIVKNNFKEGWKLSKVKRKNQLTQIFRKDLTERKLERRTRIKIMISASPSLVSSHKVHNVRFEN